MDLAILAGLAIRRVSCTGLQLRRRIAGECGDCPVQSGQSGLSITNQGNQSVSFTFKEGFTNLDLDSSPSEGARIPTHRNMNGPWEPSAQRHAVGALGRAPARKGSGRGAHPGRAVGKGNGGACEGSAGGGEARRRQHATPERAVAHSPAPVRAWATAGRAWLSSPTRCGVGRSRSR